MRFDRAERGRKLEQQGQTTAFTMPSMSTTSAITISYEIKPPSGVDTTGLETSKMYAIAVNKGVSEGQKEYYTSLRESIAQAKAVVGEDLTLWRDRVGKAELTKEPPAKADDEEEDEEEEEA
ncbi:hypothetical protein NMY22_g11923 [Coprinellus aureogranulatus]|nr:hypothetical protein NMY22_g11923 [Coprinellus aureogranulatus]